MWEDILDFLDHNPNIVLFYILKWEFKCTCEGVAALCCDKSYHVFFVFSWLHLSSIFFYFHYSACGCNVDGTVGGSCDKITGRCPCKRFVKGDKCDKCFVSI